MKLTDREVNLLERLADTISSSFTIEEIYELNSGLSKDMDTATLVMIERLKENVGKVPSLQS